ncbi:MAG: hypothetical protein GY859_01685 [Desulfobacterales bacterium]|nr:hypothetical protein [Desulfobacterales bacterium]
MDPVTTSIVTAAAGAATQTAVAGAYKKIRRNEIVGSKKNGNADVV